MRRMDLYHPDRVALAVSGLDEEIAQLEGRLRVLKRARVILTRSLPLPAQVSSPEDGGRWEDDGGTSLRHAT